MKISAFLIILLLFFSTLHAQPYIIKGSITDENNKPMPFVNILRTATKTGTITNNNGEFSLTLSGNTETLRISFIGYNTQNIDIQRNTGFVNIQLKPSISQLSGVTVNALTAPALLKKAIEKIPENYPQTPFLVKLFARHKLFEKDTLRYLQEMSHNVVMSYHRGFSDEIFLVKNRNFRFDSVRRNEVLLGTGYFDFVKDAHKIFDSRFFRNFDIHYQANTTFDDRPVFVIQYARKENKNAAYGKIYIDEKDLAFVRFEIGRNMAQYSKIGDKYYLMHGNGVRLNRHFGRVIPVESDFSITEILDTFSKNDIEGIPVKKMDILEIYATQENDTLFWQEHHAILPDSTILQAVEKHIEKETEKAKKQEIFEKSIQYQSYIKRLYAPNLSLIGSSDLSDDFPTLNHNLHSINRLVPYLLDKNINKIIPKTLSLLTYSYVLSPNFGNVASEWWFLNQNGLQAKMNPIMFNRYESAYLYGINNEKLSNFKTDNYLNFMRLHTVRNEGNLARMLLIEEDLAKINLSNKNNKTDYTMLYFMELFWLRTMENLGNLSKKDVKSSKKSELNQPLIVDRRRSWANYLFNPETPYQRHIRQDDLSEEAQKYARNSRYWSFLNLLSPQMLGIRKFSLGENHRFTFSINYLPTPFGEMFAQHIWLQTNHRQLHGVFVRQYKALKHSTLGIGYKLYDVPLFPRMRVTSSLDFWQQPTDFDFRATTSFAGFHIGQLFEYQLLRSPFSHQNKFSLLLGYDYKTKGYMPESFFVEENFDVKIGCKWFF